MGEVEIFTIARSSSKDCANLIARDDVSSRELEAEGMRFGQWLLENSSTSFLKGLHHLFDEAEITKKIGLGY
jgi:hypothetical protein